MSSKPGGLATRDRKEPSPVDGGIPFEALLAAAHSNSAGSLENQGQLSPGQMFEPAAADAHERRRAALKAEDRAGRLAGTVGGRNDSTSVQARRAAREASDGDVRRSSHDLTAAAGMRSGLERSPAASKGSSALASPAPENDSAPSSLIRSGVVTSGRSHTPSVPIPTGRFDHDGARLAPSPENPAVGSVVPAASGKALGPVRSFGGPVAQQVGEFLATGRVGEADGTRSVSPAAGPQASRPTARSGATEITGRGVGAEAGAKSAHDSSTKVPSDFDRLVRSVRMKMGSRHSSARLHLEPPQLGRVQVDVRMNGSDLQIGVRTETLDARSLLAERAVALRTALEQWGIRIERFEITADGLGGHSPEFDSGSDAEPAGDSGGGERLPQSDPAPDRSDSENVGSPVEPESEEDLAVVAEARLDIRA